MDIYQPVKGSVWFVEYQSTTDTITAVVTSITPNTGYVWGARLSNNVASWVCTVVSATYTATNTYTLIILPSPSTPPEIMDLEIFADNTYAISRSSVAVIYDYDEDFYYAHLSDEHIIASKSPGPPYIKTKELSTVVTSTLNLINPRFVIHTGDNVEHIGVAGNYANYNAFLTSKATATFPCLWMPGSHEDGGYNWTPAGMGPRWWNRNMGDISIIASEPASATAKTAALAALTASYLPNSGINFRILAQHYIGIGVGCIANTDLVGYSPTDYTHFMMLGGHIHTTCWVYKEPTHAMWFILGLTTQYGMSSIMPVTKVSGLWRFDATYLSQYRAYPNYSPGTGPADVTLVNNATLQPNIYSTWTSVNNGLMETNSVLVVNNTAREYSDGRLKFVMKAGRVYRLSNAESLVEYDAPGVGRVILARVDIPANTSFVVSIVPVSHSVYVLKPVSGNPTATSVESTELTLPSTYGSDLKHFPDILGGAEEEDDKIV